VALAREAGVPVHTDAVQALGKIDVSVDQLGADLLSLTGHKLGGPVGTGVLVVRNGVVLAPLLYGGSQEGGLRPGTHDVAGAVGMAEAVGLAVAEQPEFTRRVGGLRDQLESALSEGLPGLVVHGSAGVRAPHILNVGIPDTDGDVLLASLDLEGLAVSSGSACQSGTSGPSHVLEALLGADDLPDAAIRFSLGRTTTAQEVESAVTRTLAVTDRIGGVAA